MLEITPPLRHKWNNIPCSRKAHTSLYQVSHSNLDRISVYTRRYLPYAHRRNYDLVKRLGTIAKIHNSSIPVVLKSWEYHTFYQDYVEEEKLFFQDNFETWIFLSDAEVSFLNDML